MPKHTTDTTDDIAKYNAESSKHSAAKYAAGFLQSNGNLVRIDAKMIGVWTLSVLERTGSMSISRTSAGLAGSMMLRPNHTRSSLPRWLPQTAMPVRSEWALILQCRRFLIWIQWIHSIRCILLLNLHFHAILFNKMQTFQWNFLVWSRQSAKSVSDIYFDWTVLPWHQWIPLHLAFHTNL